MYCQFPNTYALEKKIEKGPSIITLFNTFFEGCKFKDHTVYYTVCDQTKCSIKL